MADRRTAGRCLIVLAGVSTRLSADPASSDWHQFLNFRPAEFGIPADTLVESDLPAHVRVDELIASGHLAVITRAELDVARTCRAQAVKQIQAQMAAEQATAAES